MDCTKLLYSGKYTKPPVSQSTFIELAELCTCNVLMLTHDRYYREGDGLVMESPPAPLLVNGWLNKFDSQIKDSAKLYSQYMDDIIREIKVNEIHQKLVETNSYHPTLKFTMERENENTIPFLGMKIIRKNCKLSSTWCTKATDTGLTMNFQQGTRDQLSPALYIEYTILVVCGSIFMKAKNILKNIHHISK